MPKGDRYIDLTRYLQNSGCDEVTLSFEQIANIVGGLPDAAYKYQAYWSDGSGGSFSYGWLNAGYSLRVNFRGKQAVFTKRSSGQFVVRSISNMSAPVSGTLDIEKAIESIRKYQNTTVDGKHTRYRSWEHCYNAFHDNRHLPDKTEFLSLHLAWYLASWGMLRNSFLMDRDYLVHMPLVTTFLDCEYEPLFQNKNTSETIPLVMSASEEIRKAYGGTEVTDTLITKILLGVFGCAPAYDRYFREAARKYQVCSGVWNEKSLRSLCGYYEKHREQFDALQREFAADGLYYPPMKLLDMCLWQIGFDERSVLYAH